MNGQEYLDFLGTQGLDASSVAGAEEWGAQMDRSVSQMRSALLELGYISQ